MISQIFSCKFLHILIASVSVHPVHFIFQTCQIVAGPRTISRFHEFSYLIFGGFLKFATTVLQPIALNARAHEHTRVLRHSIIFVHAYNKVINTKYRICKSNSLFFCTSWSLVCAFFRSDQNPKEPNPKEQIARTNIHVF